MDKELGRPSGLSSQATEPKVSALRASIPDADIAFEELHGCMIRRPGPTCEVRKEFLSVALDAVQDRKLLLADMEKLEKGDEFMSYCEGCSAPLLTSDDFVSGDDCSGCWHTMVEDPPKVKPCFSYRVGMPTGALAMEARQGGDSSASAIHDSAGRKATPKGTD